ncbi:Biotin-requiring enzyme [Halogranum amylolyticum]|uniref:Biotin-requiring enzyme n=1 Tax=Halogranum amylolyticum TaxID=660520 RepID=A0A1H8UPS8_9EURY|nr:lipoyl domain-containing protein [Halogranum amylolyticum]SEP05116.1 Biotin-requiring enzyme [Halogranum amylolyticum]
MSEETTVSASSVWPEDAADVEEGYLANWFVRPGATVEAGETLCEVQVEKVSVDVPAPVDGTLTERLVEEGDEFTREDPLARIDSDD